MGQSQVKRKCTYAAAAPAAGLMSKAHKGLLIEGLVRNMNKGVAGGRGFIGSESELMALDGLLGGQG